jgi:hypothetical protein
VLRSRSGSFPRRFGGTHRSVKELAEAITHWVGTWNDDPRSYVWHKTADEIFDSLAFYCQRISESGH